MEPQTQPQLPDSYTQVGWICSPTYALGYEGHDNVLAG